MLTDWIIICLLWNTVMRGDQKALTELLFQVQDKHVGKALFAGVVQRR
jgi:hypothetical protein